MGEQTRDGMLLELQRRIADAKGWTALVYDVATDNLCGIEPEHTHTWAAPKWAQHIADAWALLGEMAGPHDWWELTRLPNAGDYVFIGRWMGTGEGWSEAEAIARAWCAWKGIDLSDLPTIAPSPTTEVQHG